jgi:hypothetical protein
MASIGNSTFLALTVDQTQFFSADKTAKSTDDLAFCEGFLQLLMSYSGSYHQFKFDFVVGIEEGEEVEKITEVLSRRFTTGSGGSADIYTSVGQNVLVALNP